MKKEKITDVQKKYFLSGILENIIVHYDYEEKLCRLKINFQTTCYYIGGQKRVGNPPLNILSLL
jgi:hypothetical protein